MNGEHEPPTYGPKMPPRDPAAVARGMMQKARQDAIIQRAGLEVRSLAENVIECTRTAGVVLGVLRVVDVYPAPWSVIGLLLAGPFLINVSILAVAWFWRPKSIR